MAKGPGLPPIPERPKRRTVGISLRLPEDLVEALDVYAKGQRKTRTQAIEHILRHGLGLLGPP